MAGVILGSDLGVELLLLEPDFAARHDLVADRLDAFLERIIGLGAQPRVGEALLQLLGTAKVTKDDIELANDKLEKLDLLIEKPQHVRFDRSARGKVDDVRLTSLPDAMDAPDALFDDHRVPRKLVIHEHIAELKIQALRAGACRDEYRLGLRLELSESLRALRHRETSRIHHRRSTELPHALGDQVEGW